MTASKSNPSRAMLSALWERGLPRLRERLAELDQASEAAGSGLLEAEERQHAAEIAHKLSGSLGMFGFTAGTDAARAIELLLEADGTCDAAALRAQVIALRRSLPI